MTHSQLVGDLRRLGLPFGAHVLVHMSLSKIGWVEGGAPTVIAALQETVGEGGTVLFPSITGTRFCSPENPPTFDARSDPGRNMGLVSETARTMKRAVRSLSPTHSVVAIGALAEWLCEAHHRSETPCGPESPYERLTRVGGKILLIGVDHDRNTSIHMLEEEAGVPYHMLPGSATTTVIDQAGNERTVVARFHRHGVERHFNRIAPILERGGAEKLGKIGQADARLIDAAAMRRLGLQALQREPELFLTEP